jgi:hypothetical protein
MTPTSLCLKWDPSFWTICKLVYDFIINYLNYYSTFTHSFGWCFPVPDLADKKKNEKEKRDTKSTEIAPFSTNRLFPLQPDAPLPRQ